MADTISAEVLFAEDMADPAYRAEWERTALARGVAKAVIRHRIDHGLSQTALARTLGMRQPNVARLEAGDHNPSIDMLARLAAGLGVRFVVDIAPTSAATPIELPVGLDLLEQVTSAGGGRVLIAGGRSTPA